MKRKPIASSRVYVNWPTLYGQILHGHTKPRKVFEVTVNIWGNLDDLRDHRNGWRGGERGTTLAFWCVPEDRHIVGCDGKLRRTPYFGEINLSASACNAEIVAHECFHAVMALARRIGRNPACARQKDDQNREELFARAHSQLFIGAFGLLKKARASIARKRKKQWEWMDGVLRITPHDTGQTRSSARGSR